MQWFKLQDVDLGIFSPFLMQVTEEWSKAQPFTCLIALLFAQSDFSSMDEFSKLCQQLATAVLFKYGLAMGGTLSDLMPTGAGSHDIFFSYWFDRSRLASDIFKRATNVMKLFVEDVSDMVIETVAPTVARFAALLVGIGMGGVGSKNGILFDVSTTQEQERWKPRLETLAAQDPIPFPPPERVISYSPKMLRFAWYFFRGIDQRGSLVDAWIQACDRCLERALSGTTSAADFKFLHRYLSDKNTPVARVMRLFLHIRGPLPLSNNGTEILVTLVKDHPQLSDIVALLCHRVSKADPKQLIIHPEDVLRPLWTELLKKLARVSDSTGVIRHCSTWLRCLATLRHFRHPVDPSQRLDFLRLRHQIDSEGLMVSDVLFLLSQNVALLSKELSSECTEMLHIVFDDLATSCPTPALALSNVVKCIPTFPLDNSLRSVVVRVMAALLERRTPEASRPRDLAAITFFLARNNFRLHEKNALFDEWLPLILDVVEQTQSAEPWELTDIYTYIAELATSLDKGDRLTLLSAYSLHELQRMVPYARMATQWAQHCAAMATVSDTIIGLDSTRRARWANAFVNVLVGTSGSSPLAEVSSYVWSDDPRDRVQALAEWFRALIPSGVPAEAITRYASPDYMRFADAYVRDTLAQALQRAWQWSDSDVRRFTAWLQDDDDD